ncbi:MAG TPA: ABC transporter permease [Acidobacteriaceae bacterium]|jgi:predicted permease|nr:ABC transporter permease [Acidobacteriaceae bacterium]
MFDRLLSDLRYRLRALFHRKAMEEELDDELRFHFENETEKLRRSGMNEQEAKRRARLAMGGHPQVQQDCREARGTTFLETSLQDATYALRQLVANPTFSIVMILTLALSIGANSAIFSVVDNVLVRSLPYPHPDRIVRIFLTSPTYPRFPLNPFDFRDYRARTRSFSSLAAFTRSDMQLSGNSGQPRMLNGFGITSGFFRVLGLSPQLGHEFTPANELPNSAREVIISDRLWRTRFAASPAIIGRKITLNAMPFTVIGVMPPGTEHPGNEYHPIAYGHDVDVWSPFWFEGNPTQRGPHYLEGIGRLKDGVSYAQAQSELDAVMTEINRENIANPNRWRVLVVPLNQEIVGRSRTMLLVLLGAVGMVLLIACANAANLLLARAAARRRELAVRLALGAPRSRLIRQLLTESLLIAAAGGLLGLALAAGGVTAIVSLLPSDFPRAHDIHISAPVFAFTFLVSVVTGLLFGLAPALQAARTDPRSGLHEGGRSTTGSRGQQRLRSALVVSEVTLACVLLIGAGLMLRSLLNLLHVNPGFRQDHVLTAILSLPAANYKDDALTAVFFQKLMADLRSTPGVEAAGAGSDLPWNGWDENTSFAIQGKQPPPHEEFHGRYHCATPDYFRALGTPLLSGRFFTDADKKDAPSVIIVNHALAAKYWPGEDAIGKRITFEDQPKEKDWLTIVGVVGDVKDQPGSPGADPGFWWPHQQVAFRDMALVVRSSSDPEGLADAVRNAVHHLDPSLAVANVQLMDQIVEESVATPRLAFILVGLFAGLAILLAAIGTYGVISYTVSQRTSEFGLRLALGAQRLDLLRLVLAQGAGLILTGTAAGLCLALLLARILKSLIYNVSPADPLTFGAVAVLVVAVALLASWFPARRAAKSDPMVALRAE